MQRPVARAFAITTALALAALGLVAAAGSAAADDYHGASGFTAQLFAAGGPGRTAPDDITQMAGSIFVAWQNNAGPTGNPVGSHSTVVQYSPAGKVLNSWDTLIGRVDGMTADPAHERIIATVNEDGNTSLYTIQLGDEGGSHLVHYQYDPATLVHGGGTDAPHIYRGQIFISASNPSDTNQPAVYRATLSGTTATLKPVFSDNATATVANTDSTDYGKQTTLALSDPDSNAVVPASSPRFGRDFMLDGQGDMQQVYVRNAGRSNQKLFVLNLSQSVDDTAWATASRGTLYVTDSHNSKVYALRGHFDVGAAFSSVTPCNANTPDPACATSTPPQNYLATLNLNTGALSQVAGLTIHAIWAKGQLFVPGESEDGGDGNGD